MRAPLERSTTSPDSMKPGSSRRRATRRIRITVFASMLLTILVATPSGAVPGPEQSQYDFFDIFVKEVLPDGDTEYDRTEFDVGAGWDFGDRAAYSCAWAEFFQGGNELFEVHYEMVIGYPVSIEINDRHGAEAGDDQIAALCGDGDGPAPSVSHDGSDHFPHSTSLVFFQNGQEIARIDYSEQCTNGYWTPGNQAGEAWLWWDADGPSDMMEHGDGLCGGGPGEPVAIVRAFPQNVSAGITVCTTDAMHGDLCGEVGTGGSPVTHPSDVTLRLRGHLRAIGVVGGHVPECVADRTVVIERRASGTWKSVGNDLTDAEGDYRVNLRDRDGRYRAQVSSHTLASGDVCDSARSRVRVNS